MKHHATPHPGNHRRSHPAWRTGPGASRRHRPHRASDQDLLADHDRGNRGAPETVREGRHRGGADDLSRRRRDVRGDGGGRGRRHPRRHLAGVGRTQEGRELQGARQCRHGLLRLAIDDAFEIDARRQGPERQEGRDHLRRLRLRPAGAVDPAGQEDRVHPRARRRRRAGAEPARRQCRCGGGLFAAELPDLQIGRSAHHPRLRQGGAAEPRRRLDRARQIRAGQAADGAEDAERALRRADVHARQQGRLRQADHRALRNSRRDRGAGIREHDHEAGNRRQHGRRRRFRSSFSLRSTWPRPAA